MHETIPTVGRTVIYRLTKEEQAFLANHGCNSSVALPATIVSVWGKTPDCAFNVKVHIDGPLPDMWKTSVSIDRGTPDTENEGKLIYQDGRCHWPERA